MTEEIIIDGVDVAGCEHYTTMEDCDGIHDLCEQLDDYCSIKKNCYYKQLKRLEQENKELRQQYNCYACDTCQGKEDYRNMKRHCENAIKTVHKYSSVLNEIRKIAEDVEDASSIRFYRIKRKINEVLNDT